MPKLKDLLAQLSDADLEDDVEHRKDFDLPKDMQDTLQELSSVERSYNGPNPYSPGDLVTVRKKRGKKGHGCPGVVLVASNEAFTADDLGGTSGEPGTQVFGDSFTLYIAMYVPTGDIVRYWGHHSDYEPLQVS